MCILTIYLCIIFATLGSVFSWKCTYKHAASRNFSVLFNKKIYLLKLKLVQIAHLHKKEALFLTTEEFQKQIADNPFAAINDLVYKHLYDNIVTMEIVPGSSPNESSIAKELQISRTPIRSAIELLERDGLAKREKGRPAIVRPLDAAEYHYISELRYAIEGQAAACAARYITPEELPQLKAIVDDMSRSGGSRVPYPINDTSFHDIIVNASRNPFLIKGYRLYRAKILRYRWHIHLNKSEAKRS